MIPQIITIPIPGLNISLPINSFGLMVALAFIAGTYRLALSFRTNNVNPALAERFVFTSAVAGLVGARLWYVFTYPLEGRFLESLFATGGFVFYGGFIFAILALIFMCRKEKVAFHSFFDSAGPATALGYIIGRAGCQLSGDGDYGLYTTSWLGMSYSTGVIPTPPGLEAYPTPLYESAICLLILPILLKAETSPAWQTPWRRTGLYLTLLSAERFLIEFLRIERRIGFGLSEAQYIAIIAFVIGLVLTLRRGAPPAVEAHAA